MIRPCAELISITSQTEFKIVEMARVSAPVNTTAPWQTATREAQSRRLIKYLIDHKHWSPFEMASMTVKITTTRDISRQILRHRSFSFQEFSQRYQDIKVLNSDPIFRECRMQDTKNRQNSISLDDSEKSADLKHLWYEQQRTVWDTCMTAYNNALELGISKEVARALLPEGLTETQMYMTGSIRSWIHYLQIRASEETQKEHRIVANSIKKIFELQMPIIYDCVFAHFVADSSVNKESANNF